MINQMNGVYKVKHPGLLPLYEEADRLRRDFDQVTLRHVRREHNKRADRLCNQALDSAAAAGPLRKSSSPLTKNTPAPIGPEDPNRRDLERLVRDDALTCLRASAAAWTRDKDVKLKPEHVWEQIWSILVEAGVLKKRK
jgi:hypothetical protein